jgi:hypothetical protein
MDIEQEAQLIRTMFELRGTRFSRCFAPGVDCKNDAIRAHSVQNARVMDLLSEDGHVVAPHLRLHKRKPPSVEFARTGRNWATTFTGLCAAHDQQLFAPIENQKLDFTSPQHLFLLSYRAVQFEAHATAQAGWQIQQMYQKRVKLGVDPGDRPSESGLFATERLIVAYETHMYKATFDQDYLGQQYSNVEHDIFRLSVSRPTIAASALFNLTEVGGDTVYVALTIVPASETETIALLSYRKAHAARARSKLKEITKSSGQTQKYRLSRRLLHNCQNFIISPSYYRSWSNTKRFTIIEFFRRTVLEDDLAFNDPDLMLFA